MFLSYFFNDLFLVIILYFKLLLFFTSIVSLAYHTKLDSHVYESR